MVLKRLNLDSGDLPLGYHRDDEGQVNFLLLCTLVILVSGFFFFKTMGKDYFHSLRNYKNEGIPWWSNG